MEKIGLEVIGCLLSDGVWEVLAHGSPGRHETWSRLPINPSAVGAGPK